MDIVIKVLKIEEAYGVVMWVSPYERCEQMVQGQAIDKVHRRMSLYELFGQSVRPSHKKKVVW